MSKLAYLHSEGVTDLHSYFVGVTDEQERIIEALQKILDDRVAAANGGLYSKTIGIQEAIQLIKDEK